ncbi:transporter [Pseudomonas sp. CFBP 13727]|uniref:transporter n=1 Tax=Pseudomonas sp. CFBP 13727 TaxID=2775295 RepID=UPI00177C3542|nr:transporter [Pseudomonas sp. CFBP 13727]MBD8623567.1 transporter [Pseudomonas sp. CFBP 13727]
MSIPSSLTHFAASVSILLSTAPVAMADTVHLKNGDSLSGRLISYEGDVCVFSASYGTGLNIPGPEIASLQTDHDYEVRFKNGELASGRLMSNGATLTLLTSTTFGEVEVRMTEIQALTRSFVEERNPEAEDVPAEYGERTEQPPLDFLVGSTVLLGPGEYEFDMGLVYKQSRRQHNLFDVGYFQKSSYSARVIQFEPTLRAGLFDRLEGHLAVPFTYTSVEDVSSNEYVSTTGAWDLADIGFGVQYQWLDETSAHPALSFTFDIGAPTGRKRYNDAANRWKDPLNNGSGHWNVAPGIAWVRSTDPAILFGGLSYQHFFKSTIDGYAVKPGWALRSYLGAGFALNEKLSIGARFSYSYSANLKADRQIIKGTDIDPADLAFNLSYRLHDDWVVSPQIMLGLNDDAGPASMSLNLKRQFN